MANETYEVTGQAEVLDTTDVTNPVQSQRITFKSKASGVSGTVTLPLAGLTAQAVHDAITARVATIDAIHNL